MFDVLHKMFISPNQLGNYAHTPNAQPSTSKSLIMLIENYIRGEL